MRVGSLVRGGIVEAKFVKLSRLNTSLELEVRFEHIPICHKHVCHSDIVTEAEARQVNMPDSLLAHSDVRPAMAKPVPRVSSSTNSHNLYNRYQLNEQPTVQKNQRTANGTKRGMVQPRAERGALIPRPKGEPGCTPPRGFSIQQAIGLTEDRPKYNRLVVRCIGIKSASDRVC